MKKKTDMLTDKDGFTYTESNDGIFRTELSATVRLDAVELSALRSLHRKAEEATFQDVLDICFDFGIECALLRFATERLLTCERKEKK